jgi:hypothetical protein
MHHPSSCLLITLTASTFFTTEIWSMITTAGLIVLTMVL